MRAEVVHLLFKHFRGNEKRGITNMANVSLHLFRLIKYDLKATLIHSNKLSNLILA